MTPPDDADRPMSRPLVLAGFDGHDRTPVRAGELFAGLLEADLHVADVCRFEDRGSEAQTGNLRRLAAAQQKLGAVREVLDTDVATSVVPAGDTAKALSAAAAELDACLVAVGADQRGDVTRDVIAGVRCPVLVAPAEELLVPAAIRSVAVAWDGSAGSRMALTAAAAVARKADASLTVVHWSFGHSPERELRTAVVDALGPQASELDLEVSVRRGAPGPMLRELGERSDLLACGSRGRGRITGNLLGSVSAFVVDRPPALTLVVPAHARPRRGGPLGITTAHPL